MRAPLLSLLLATACIIREAPADDATGETPDTTSDPTQATDPTTGELANPSGFCSPIAQDAGACPAGYICCSDDPATTNGRLPNYHNGKIDEVFGTPIFSAANNLLSHSGQCVDVGGFSSPLASGCAVPCDPTWETATREQICGTDQVCCPFRQVDPLKDCIRDPTTERWRAAHGSDLFKHLTTWGPAHTTNQDPDGSSCMMFADAGVGGGLIDKDVLLDCYEQLTVADRRGFCYNTCPCYEDLCDMKNADWQPRCG